MTPTGRCVCAALMLAFAGLGPANADEAPPQRAGAGVLALSSQTGEADSAEAVSGTAAAAGGTTTDKRAIVAMTLKEAIVRGLRNDPELAVERVSFSIAKAAVDVPWGPFDPAFFSSGNYGKNRDPYFSVNPFGGPVNPVTGFPEGLIVNPSDVSNVNAGVRVRTLLGTALQLSYGLERRTTENEFALSPAYTTAATATLTHPLLRGFGFDVNRAFIEIARNEERISETRFRERALDVAFAVEEAYWGFVLARENLKVAELAVATAKDLLEINRRKLQVGRVAEIEVLVAETGVATREEAVIVARNQVLNARDQLFRLVMPVPPTGTEGARARKRVRSWDLELVALDEPRTDEEPVDPEAAFASALERRPDLQQLAIALTNQDIRMERAWNERLPRLDAVGSWSQLGLNDSLHDSVDTQLDGDYYDWSIGFQFEVPFFNYSARAQHREAELGRLQVQKQLEALEQTIVLEVRTATRNIEAARERLRATGVAQRLAERQLENERQRLDAGLATNHDVLLFEQDLTAARTNFVKARVDHSVARARLARATATLLDRFGVRVTD